MKITILTAIIVLTVFNVYAACGGTYSGSSPGTITAYDATDECVQLAIDAATAVGDVVQIPTGTETWSTGVTLAVNITLQGNGTGNTVITSGSPTREAYEGVIQYNGTFPSATAAFELSNLTLNMGSDTGTAIGFTHNSTSIMQLLNVHDLIIDTGGLVFYWIGIFKGAVYGNDFTTTAQFQQNVGPSDGGLAAWNAIQKCSGSPLSCSHDDGNNLYIEDNTMDIDDTNMQSGGAGFSWVYRYNTVTYHSVSPALEWHGNYAASIQRCSSMDMAVYGNSLTPGTSPGVPYIQPRGGMGLVFYNYANATSSSTWNINFREEDDQGDASGPCSADTNPQVQNISDTYVWVNEKGDGLTYAFTEDDIYNQIAENTDYFIMQSGIFDGTGSTGGGVGCGVSGDLPATCTTGVGYWATDQSCSDLTGMVGANPSTPISGTLYKCTSTDTWESYYTPYTYPHPLRNQNSRFTQAGNTTFAQSGNTTFTQ